MVKYCPNCGKPNKEGDKFCNDCGSSMNPRSPMISKTEGQPSNNSLIADLLSKINIKALLIGGLICIASILIFHNILIHVIRLVTDWRSYFTLIFILSPLVVGLLLYKKNYSAVAVNGAIIGLIPYLYILSYNISNFPHPTTFGTTNGYTAAILDLIFYPILGAITAIIGKVLGSIINKINSS